MKRFLAIATVVTLFCSALTCDTFAQRPFERLQRGWDDIRPRGRILRELFGENESQSDRQRQQQMLEEQKRRAERMRNNGPQPTRAQNGNQSRDQARNQTGQRNNANRPEYDRAGVASARKSAPHPTRLEILVKEDDKRKGLLVEKINPSGSAWAAGIRSGDVILNVGGLEVEAKEDIANIVGVLKDGDQVEFEVDRRGKKEKMLVQFGDAPEQPAESESAPGRQNNGQIASGRIGDVVQPPSSDRNFDIPSDYQRRNQGQNQQQELTGNLGMRSVLERRPLADPPRRSTNAQSASAGTNWAVQPPQGNRVPSQSNGNQRNRYQTPPANQGQARQQGQVDYSQLQRQLDAQQQEINRLRQQLQDAQQSNLPSVPPVPPVENLDVDSLLDFPGGQE